MHGPRPEGETAEYPDPFAATVDAIEAEAQAWCREHLRVANPEDWLRTDALRPRIMDALNNDGVITADSKVWAAAVAEVTTAASSVP